MDATAEKRFLALKRRLDALNYCKPLGIESAALAESLLNDLVKTTEGFQSLKKKNTELRDNLEKAQQALLPLKKENERVVRESNDLHRELIRVREDAEKKELHRPAPEEQDLKFVVEQKEVRIRDLEKDLLEMRERLDKVLRTQRGGKGEPAAGSNIFISRTLEGDRILKELDSNARDPEQRVWAEELRSADERANKFREDVRRLEAMLKSTEQRNCVLERQVGTRDSEISRLH